MTTNKRKLDEKHSWSPQSVKDVPEASVRSTASSPSCSSQSLFFIDSRKIRQELQSVLSLRKVSELQLQNCTSANYGVHTCSLCLPVLGENNNQREKISALHPRRMEIHDTRCAGAISLSFVKNGETKEGQHHFDPDESLQIKGWNVIPSSPTIPRI